MGEVSKRLKTRTMRFALRVCAVFARLPPSEPGQTVRRQLAKSATSVAFNYRASCRARSHAEFTARIGLVAEESDETLGWLEFVQAAGLTGSEEVSSLIEEARELVAIFSPAHGTARYKERRRSR